MRKKYIEGVDDLASPEYTPVRLINETAHKLGAMTDHQLCIKLDMDSGQLSRIRHRKDPVTHRMLIQIMDRTKWNLEYVRELMGAPYKW